MKIAFVYDVIHPYVIGGAQKRVWEVATRLSSKGHQVTVFGMKHWEGKQVIEKEGVRLWGVCPPHPLFVNGHRSIKEALYFAWHLLHPLMKEKYDVIDAANFPYFPCFTAAFHHLSRGSRLVITWHEIWDDYWFQYLGKKGFIGRSVERLTVRLPHQAVAVSDRTKLNLQKLGRKDVRVIPSGVDLAAIQEVPPSAVNTDIIFVGRMIKEKNISLLINAVRVIKEQGRNLTCLLVGDGPEKTHLQTMITDLGLQANVRIRNDIEDGPEVFSLMKSSRLLVLPSVREGLGLVVIEANACGIPAVVVRHPHSAASDLIVEGENGFSCDLSPADLAAKMLTAVDRRQPWDQACRKYAQGYDWKIVVEALEKVYRGP